MLRVLLLLVVLVAGSGDRWGPPLLELLALRRLTAAAHGHTRLRPRRHRQKLHLRGPDRPAPG